MTSASNKPRQIFTPPCTLACIAIRHPPSTPIIVCADWMVLAVFRSLFLRVTIRLSSEHKHDLPCDDSCGWSRRGGIAPQPKEPVGWFPGIKRQILSSHLRLTFRWLPESAKRCRQCQRHTASVLDVCFVTWTDHLVFMVGGCWTIEISNKLRRNRGTFLQSPPPTPPTFGVLAWTQTSACRHDYVPLMTCLTPSHGAHHWFTFGPPQPRTVSWEGGGGNEDYEKWRSSACLKMYFRDVSLRHVLRYLVPPWLLWGGVVERATGSCTGWRRCRWPYCRRCVHPLNIKHAIRCPFLFALSVQNHAVFPFTFFLYLSILGMHTPEWPTDTRRPRWVGDVHGPSRLPHNG